jgi:putative Mg2+ transporter-C (MgtC) family protein
MNHESICRRPIAVTWGAAARFSLGSFERAQCAQIEDRLRGQVGAYNSHSRKIGGSGELFMDVDWWQIWDSVYHMLIAFVLALPLGLDRERRARSAGLRTFPLVAVAACGFMLVGLREFAAGDAQARVVYGIITGIGFIGGGAILKKDGGHVSGTATAASLWTTGAIGVAVANDRYEIAIVLALLNFLTLSIGRRIKKQVEKDESDDAA